MGTTDFRLLGPFEVWRDGAPLALGGRRQRAVLALLALHAGTVVSTDRIVEEIWADAPPPSALRTLHSYVSRLRSILRTDGQDPLVRREPGYVLEIEPSDLDTVRFERLVLEAAAALDADDPEAADRALGVGLELWRGEALADFAYEPFATAEARRLEERRLEALELRVDVDLTLGRHAQVVSELEVLVAAHPYRERFWAQLMVALYRCGRQADALAAYARIREILVEEQGIEPGDELRLLERQVLEQSTDLTLPGVPPGARRPGVPSAPAPTAARRMPLPERLLVQPDIGVIGRTAEIGTLAAGVERADRGAGRAVLLISGEAGQGKSTVVAEVARRAFDDGAQVLSGHCEQDLSSPYQLFAESLGHYVRHAPEDELAEVVEEHGPELGALLPGLAARLPGLPPLRAVDPDSERVKLFAAVVGLLARISRDRTVVLVLDDLQWADHGSLQLLRHLAADDRPKRLAVVGTFRDSELAESDQLIETLGALRRLDGVDRIELPGFEPVEVVSVMGAIAGRPMDERGEALASAVHEETDGNPFFVSEVTRHLLEVGALRHDASEGWVAPAELGEASLPAGVREVIDARVVRLGKEAAAALSLAAVIGRDFDLDLLLATTTQSPDDLLDTLEGAATVSLVREPLDRPGWYTFSHALIQRTLYEGMGASRRALLHRKVFDVLEERDAAARGAAGRVPGAEMARHLVASARPDDAAAVVRYARRAAEEAEAALNPEEAVRWYSVALDALGDEVDATRAQVLSRLGEVQRQSGDTAYRATLLEAARLAQQFDDVDTLVFAALANSRQIQSTTGTIDQERVDVLEASLERIGPEPTAERARLLAHLASDRSYDGDPERRARLVEEALAIARQVDDPGTTFDVLLRRVGIWMPADVHERLAESAETLAIAEALADPVARFWALFYRAIVAAEAADRALLEECRARVPEEARTTGQPMLLWSTTYTQSCHALLDGAIEEAEALAAAALEQGMATGQPDALAIYGGQMVDLRWHQGRDAELVELIEQMVEATPEIDSFQAALARIYADIGRADDARRLLAAGAAERFAHPFDPLATTTIALWSETAVQLGDREAAAVLIERLDDFADQVICSGVNIFGSLDHYRGALHAVLGRFDDAERLLTLGLATHETLGAPFFEARSCLELARMYRARGGASDGDAAEQLAGRALEVARRFGYAGVERRVVELVDA